MVLWILSPLEGRNAGPHMAKKQMSVNLSLKILFPFSSKFATLNSKLEYINSTQVCKSSYFFSSRLIILRDVLQASVAEWATSTWISRRRRKGCPGLHILHRRGCHQGNVSGLSETNLCCSKEAVIGDWVLLTIVQDTGFSEPSRTSLCVIGSTHWFFTNECQFFFWRNCLRQLRVLLLQSSLTIFLAAFFHTPASPQDLVIINFLVILGLHLDVLSFKKSSWVAVPLGSPAALCPLTVEVVVL